MKNIPIVLLIVGIIVIAVLAYGQYKHNQKMERACFDLPRTGDSAVFGPYYWRAFHTLAGKVPCGICRGFAEKFMIFFHDVVNVKLGKPIYNEENFKFFTHLFADMDKGVDVFSEEYSKQLPE